MIIFTLRPLSTNVRIRKKQPALSKNKRNNNFCNTSILNPPYINLPLYLFRPSKIHFVEKIVKQKNTDELTKASYREFCSTLFSGTLICPSKIVIGHIVSDLLQKLFAIKMRTKFSNSDCFFKACFTDILRYLKINF